MFLFRPTVWAWWWLSKGTFDGRWPIKKLANRAKRWAAAARSLLVSSAPSGLDRNLNHGCVMNFLNNKDCSLTQLFNIEIVQLLLTVRNDICAATQTINRNEWLKERGRSLTRKTCCYSFARIAKVWFAKGCFRQTKQLVAIFVWTSRIKSVKPFKINDMANVDEVAILNFEWNSLTCSTFAARCEYKLSIFVFVGKLNLEPYVCQWKQCEGLPVQNI